jgi:hypothetical protein
MQLLWMQIKGFAGQVIPPEALFNDAPSAAGP